MIEPVDCQIPFQDLEGYEFLTEEEQTDLGNAYGRSDLTDSENAYLAQKYHFHIPISCAAEELVMVQTVFDRLIEASQHSWPPEILEQIGCVLELSPNIVFPDHVNAHVIAHQIFISFMASQLIFERYHQLPYFQDLDDHQLQEIDHAFDELRAQYPDLTSDDLLAGLIAHELMHILSADLISRQIEHYILQKALARRNDLSMDEIHQYQSQINQRIERRCDLMAVKLVQRAGYNPQGVVVLFELCQLLDRITDQLLIAFVKQKAIEIVCCPEIVLDWISSQQDHSLEQLAEMLLLIHLEENYDYDELELFFDNDPGDALDEQIELRDRLLEWAFTYDPAPPESPVATHPSDQERIAYLWEAIDPNPTVVEEVQDDGVEAVKEAPATDQIDQQESHFPLLPK